MINKLIGNNRIIKRLLTKYQPLIIKNECGMSDYLRKEQNQMSKMKAYHKLFRSSIENDIRFLDASMAKFSKARKITKIIISNHKINSDLVIESHVENLFQLINRMEPSIEAIALYVESIYNEIGTLLKENLQSKSYLNLLKPNLLTKMIKINQSIENYYNEYFRMMMACLIMRLMRQSNANIVQLAIEQENMISQFQAIITKQKKIFDENGVEMSVFRWQREKKSQLEENYRIFNQIDYWNGFQYVISMGYYDDNFLLQNIKLLETQTQTLEHHSFFLTLIKIKAIVYLNNFKQSKIIEKHFKPLISIYKLLLDKYFAFLRNNHFLLEEIYQENNHVQTQLVTKFLEYDHYLMAKEAYYQMFKKMFNNFQGGALFLDIKKLKGYFEVMLIMFTHDDTPIMHEILSKFQKIIILYPIQKYQKLSIHYSLAQKCGFKSDIFAERLLKYVILHRQKVNKAKGHIFQVQQTHRQIQLARKCLMYIKIMVKPPKESIDEINDLIKQLFTLNIFYLMSQNDDLRLTEFISGQSISSFFMFYKTDIINLTSQHNARKRIENTQNKLGIKNNHKHYQHIVENVVNNIRDSFTAKIDHASNWKNNSHSRILSVLMLANHTYDTLVYKNQQEANAFLEKFMNKILALHVIYTALKNKIAYPELLYNFVVLFEKMDFSKSYPMQAREVQNLKKMYVIQIQNELKASKPSFQIEWQSHMDFIEFNRVTLPSNQDAFGISKLGISAKQSLMFKIMKKFQKQKEYIKMQIQTFYKFNKEGQITVVANHLEFPHLADIKVIKNSIETVIMLKFKEKEENLAHSVRENEIIKASEIYWQKKGCKMITLRSESQIEELIEIKMKKQNIFNRK